MVDTVSTFQGETQEDPNHVAQMIAKADGQEPPAPSALPSDGRPQWLPEKFQSAEDLARAYSELEKKLGSGQQPNADDIEITEENDPNQFSFGEVQDFLDSKGLDFDAFAQEVMQTGWLSEGAFQALEQAGIPRKVASTYVEGQLAIADQIRSTALNAVGGENAYAQMVQWAQANLTPGEIAAYNASLDTQDMDQAIFAIRGLQARYRSEAGFAPNLVTGQTGGTSAGSYQSLAQLTKDMGDPRYENDPAYRAAVAAKLRASNIL